MNHAGSADTIQPIVAHSVRLANHDAIAVFFRHAILPGRVETTNSDVYGEREYAGL
jgi:hypothetical protein